MAINPDDITTVRVDQLPDGILTLNSKIPHQPDLQLQKASIQELVDFVATAIGVSGGVGYIAISVSDGGQLPEVPELPSFFLAGAGTYLNINGYPNVICTDELNAIMSLEDHWELAVGIPITAEVGVQTVTGSAVDNTDPLNPVINTVVPTLQSVTDEGNTTTNDIELDEAAIVFDNGSKLQKGTTDAETGGNGGIALRCSVDYELKWEAGRLYVMEQDGFTIREVKYNFNIVPTVDEDETKGFVVGSRYILDNDDVYYCSDATTGAAVWDLIESGIPTLQQVLDNNHDLVDDNNFQGTGAGNLNTGTGVNAFGGLTANENTGSNINAFGFSAALQNAGQNVNAFGYIAAQGNTVSDVNAFGFSAGASNACSNLNALGYEAGASNGGNDVNALGYQAGYENTYNNVNLFGENAQADENGQTVLSKDGTIMARLSTNDLTATRKYNLPDASGTIALTDDITPSIPKATASGTDTYTSTITGVAAYTDGDAYLVRFTNGNTTGATLNINSLGAKDLYRNNDGLILGGDIQDGAEMLCVYNSTLNGFQCIGTSPNSLFAYVTNADSVSITKGQPVYAFGGTGDRMTVKRALNTSDATSAQTVGLVYSSSIGANQKGLIIMQGLLDGLSILPTSTYSDGDAIYLGATAGAITKTKPYAPNHLVYLGVVTTASNGSAGRMYVRIQNGYEMQELHNVQAQSPSLKDTLYYDTVDSQWKTASIGTILGYTPEDQANKSTTTTLGTSDTLYPTQNAVKTYVDTALAEQSSVGADLYLFNNY